MKYDGLNMFIWVHIYVIYLTCIYMCPYIACHSHKCFLMVLNSNGDSNKIGVFILQVQVYLLSCLEGCDMKRLRLGHMAHAGLRFCEWRQNSSSACLSWEIAEEISCLIQGQKEWLIHLPPCLAPGHCYSG